MKTEIEAAKEWLMVGKNIYEADKLCTQYGFDALLIEDHQLIQMFRKEVIEPFIGNIPNYEKSRMMLMSVESQYESAFELYLKSIQKPLNEPIKERENVMMLQFGKSVGADFEDKTWTFEMPDTFTMRAGEFAIIPKEIYDVQFANSQTKQLQWISVEDRLPEKGERVLIMTDYGGFDVCYLSMSGSFTNSMRPQHTNGCVTFWVPLPQPPQ